MPSTAETASTPYTFTHDGEEFALPLAKDITAGMLRRHRKESDLDFLFSILEETTAEDVLAALDKKPVDELNKVLTAWQKHIGLNAGN